MCICERLAPLLHLFFYFFSFSIFMWPLQTWHKCSVVTERLLQLPMCWGMNPVPLWSGSSGLLADVCRVMERSEQHGDWRWAGDTFPDCHHCDSPLGLCWSDPVFSRVCYPGGSGWDSVSGYVAGSVRFFELLLERAKRSAGAVVSPIPPSAPEIREKKLLLTSFWLQVGTVTSMTIPWGVSCVMPSSMR